MLRLRKKGDTTMYYVLIYSLLVFGSRFVLEYSQGLLVNISIVFASIYIFNLMFKKYSKSLSEIGGFKGYYQSLVDKSLEQEQLNSQLGVSSSSWWFLIYVYFIKDTYLILLSDWSHILLNLLTIALVLIVVLPLVVESTSGLKKNGAKNIIKWIFLGTVIMLGINLANGIIFELIGIEAAESVNQSMLETFLSEDFVKIAFGATILAAVYEELIFRGIFFRIFVNNSRFKAYLITFFAFGIPHLIPGLSESGLAEFMFLPLYGLMGVVFAYVYEKTGSIYTAMGSHFLNNFLSILIMYLQ